MWDSWRAEKIEKSLLERDNKQKIYELCAFEYEPDQKRSRI
jgi:hypothetical protein